MFHGTLDLDGAIPVAETAIQDVLFERGLYWASGRSGVVNLVAGFADLALVFAAREQREMSGRS